MTCSWHHRPAAQALIASLTEQDLMIVRPYSYDPDLAYRSATDHGDRVFARLHKLCHGAPNRMLAKAATQEARAAIVAWAQRRATVEQALAERFGDPCRFIGHRVDDGSATRAFRATFADKTAWAA